jgi:glycosyltransferase involved in cell wall biosynthesis
MKYIGLRIFTKLSAIRSRKVIFVSYHSESVIGNRLGIQQKRSAVIYHGIDTEPFQNPELPSTKELHSKVEKSKPFILCVSTIYRHKNYEGLINAFSILPEKIKNRYTILIAGGKPDKEYFESLLNLVAAKNLEQHIYFLGRIEYESVPYLYSNADLFVLPSRLETFGHTLVESMAAGTPIVAANSTCIPEIIDGAGRLFEPTNTDQLATEMEIVLTNENVRNELVASGNDRLGDFSWERTIKRTVQVLEEASE